MTRKKSLAGGLCFTLAAGTLLHFLYRWTGRCAAVGLFAPVNESIWEHLKMLVVPMLLYGLVERRGYAAALPNFWPVRFLSILLGMGILAGGYALYEAAGGRGSLAAGILDFLAGVGIAYLFSARLLQTARFSSRGARQLTQLGIALLLAVLMVFTWFPPHCRLFLDSPSGRYGPV